MGDGWLLAAIPSTSRPAVLSSSQMIVAQLSIGTRRVLSVSMKRALSVSNIAVKSIEVNKSMTDSVLHSCQFCTEGFPSRNKLFIHLRNRHVDSNTSGTSDNNSQSLNNNTVEDISMTVPVSEELRFLFQDDFCCIALKPQGMATMGARSGIAVHNHPLLHIPEHDVKYCGYRKAKPCHRLDAMTGGVLLCAKTLAAELVLRKAFRERHVMKTYLAIVQGKLPSKSGLITFPLSGQSSLTKFKVLKETPSHEYGTVTTVSLYPVTGRQHQLRKHLQMLGCPIIGDRRYTSALTWSREFPQLFLWSVEIKLPHPRYYFRQQEISAAVENENSNGSNTNRSDIITQGERGSAEDQDQDQDLDNDEVEAKVEAESSDPVCSEKTGVISSEGFVSTAELFLGSITDPEDILHVSINEPAYYEAFRQRQLQLFEQHQHK